jgi:DNA-binding response OmpR family regulator
VEELVFDRSCQTKADDNMPYKILIADADPRIQQQLSNALKPLSYQLVSSLNGKETLEQLEKQGFDLILLDLCLTDSSGFLFLHQIRCLSNTAIIVLSVRRDEAERLRAFDEGADDFITKPFNSLKEVALRIRAILRRAKPSELILPRLRFDLIHQRVWWQGEEIQVPRQQYRLLLALASRPNTVRTHEELIGEIYDEDDEPNDSIVHVLIHALRRLIESDSKRPQFIHCIRGIGYYLKS